MFCLLFHLEGNTLGESLEVRNRILKRKETVWYIKGYMELASLWDFQVHCTHMGSLADSSLVNHVVTYLLVLALHWRLAKSRCAVSSQTSGNGGSLLFWTPGQSTWEPGCQGSLLLSLVPQTIPPTECWAPPLWGEKQSGSEVDSVCA